MDLIVDDSNPIGSVSEELEEDYDSLITRLPSYDPDPLYRLHPATSSVLGQPAISASGWSIYTSKRPIMSASEIERATSRIEIPMPEMIFGHNYVVVSHDLSGWSLGFNTVDALDLVTKHGNPQGGLVRVSYSDAWMKDKAKSSDEVHQVVKPFDWTYTTPYCGTPTLNTTKFTKSTDSLPYDRLRRPDPILYFDDIVLFEDELGDNGAALYSVKIRVMAERLLLLARFFLRVDDVLFRVRETRLFVEFADNTILREYTIKEGPYSTIKRKVPVTARDHGLYLRDPDWISQALPVIDSFTERSQISS
ncbi:type 2A phosphatase activator TIP41 [Lipomyces oligophaga]|uniref:type 2A phosphatase activator TIP41 n=1 Tax=Lipomyces oligophaga TaxID=45792 RepID=UPI0034CDF53E